MNETLRAATPHAHATEMTRNGVACYSVMRVSAVVGGWAEAVYARVMSGGDQGRCGHRDERDAPGSKCALIHHIISAQRRRVLQRHMRVARCGGRMGGGG